MPATSTYVDPMALGLSTFQRLSGEEIMCLCPFHGDHSPSMCVNLRKGVFICYVCGESGIVNKLAVQLGGYVSKKTTSPLVKEQTDDWKMWLHSPLALDHSYLQGRGVTNEQVHQHHILKVPMGIGVPLWNSSFDGEPVGLLVRREKPGKWARYVNYGVRPFVWPIETALRQSDQLQDDTLVVTEGIFGVLNAERAGYDAVCTLGAMVSVDFKRVTMRHEGHLLVAFDDDEAGYLGACRIMMLAGIGVEIALPGVEADELSKDEWDAIVVGDYRKTRNFDDVLVQATDDNLLLRREFVKKLPDRRYFRP